MGPRFESVKVHHGPLVKWLRQRPLTPLTSVRIRYGSPDFSRAKVLDKGSEIQYNTVCSPARPDDIELVLIRARVHPFPFRTRQLSSFLLTILGWRRPGKIGSANTERQSIDCLFFVINQTTLIISKKPGNTGISRDIRTEFTTDLLLSD